MAVEALYHENTTAVNARDERRKLMAMVGYDLAAATASGGVFKSTDLAVTQAGTPNMTVLVAAGSCVVDGTQDTNQGGYFVYNDAQATVTIAAADATNPRKDLVGVQVRDSEYSGADNDARILAVTGTPSGSPAEPTPPANFMTLAMVDVPANDTAIGNAQITDRRRRVGNWNVGWGRIPATSGAESWTGGGTGSSAGAFADTAISATYPRIAGRRYRYVSTGHALSNGSTIEVVAVGLRRSSTTLIRQEVWTPQNIAVGFEVSYEETAGTTANDTVKLSVGRAAGNGTCSLFGDAERALNLRVYDVGAS